MSFIPEVDSRSSSMVFGTREEAEEAARELAKSVAPGKWKIVESDKAVNTAIINGVPRSIPRQQHKH